jgi:hypothetical protein
MINRYILFFLLFVLCLACEEKEVTIPDSSDIDSDRIVLIEEFSGVQCPNCPDGNIVVEELIDQYPKNVVSVTIHSEFLAEPFSDSKYDFRTDEAQEIEDLLGFWFGKPEAAINRKIYPNESFIRVGFPDLWPSLVESELLNAPRASVEIEHTFDVERNLTATVKVTALESISGDLRIGVYLHESHLIDKQDNNGVKESEYEHNHVLRKVLSNVEGDPIGNGLNAGESVSKEYSFTLPEETNWWKAENMELIAFVSLNEPDTKEVLQAAQVSLTE